MAPTLNSRSFGLVFISIAWALFVTIIGSPEVLLFTIPVFMLAGPLAFGRYPGEDLIVKLGRMAGSRPRPAGAVAVQGRPAAATAIRGSLLIASNLAGRAPPAPVV